MQQRSTYGFIRLEGTRSGSSLARTVRRQPEKVAGGMNKAIRTRLFAWWYFAISAGFVLLGINRWMLGERMWLVALRFGIAAGFLILGILTWRSKV